MSSKPSKEQKALWDARWKAKDPEHARAIARASARRYRESHRDEIIAARRAAYVRGTDRPHLSDEEKRMIEMLYAKGLSFKEISAKVERTGNTVARHLRTKIDIRVRPVPRGECSQNWKGGRHLHHTGYWYRRVTDNDPMAAMRSKTGLVPEHRLVMARLLGRPLLPTESVHHINGKRDDNRPENLQLRHGKHGKHIVMACLECGSHRLGPVEITSITED